jgi:hypothetical protein
VQDIAVPSAVVPVAPSGEQIAPAVTGCCARTDVARPRLTAAAARRTSMLLFIEVLS